MLQNETMEQNDIDEVVQKIGEIFERSAETSFGYVKKHSKESKLKSKNQPWFTNNCREARNTYHEARRRYNRNKTEENKNNLKTVSKNYKTTLSKALKKHKSDKIDKIRNLRNSSPREYWKLLNSNKPKDDIKASLEDLYNYFKNINNIEYTHDQTTQTPLFDTEIEHSLNEQINLPITETEITDAIKTLKNNKSSGMDNIKNEQIKASCNLMIPIYTKLFNLIFENGLIPESWSVGTIKPIYKNKGDPKLPENYRPITILSCLGKLFTAIINKRLNKFSEESELIEPCQAGFHKQHSTSDNIFIIKSLIDIMKSDKNKNKLLCCFVDFKQAFDSVWRERLWEKLQQHKINGKCLTLIKNMYINIKSSIVANNKSSIFFPCIQGVRQGENLSPFLFSISLNDLNAYLMTKQANGVNCDINYEDVSVYIKILVLLFAGDMVLFGTNEADLQYTLDLFQHYCKHMKLTVNVSKTKIVIFSSSRGNKDLHFTFQSNRIDIVDHYKYLGIVFAKMVHSLLLKSI